MSKKTKQIKRGWSAVAKQYYKEPIWSARNEYQRKITEDDHYVGNKQTKENHPFETHSSKRPIRGNIARNIGEVLEKGRKQQRQQRNAKKRQAMKTIPLTRTEARYWNKILVLKSFIKRDLSDFRQFARHQSLKNIYNLILEQHETKKHDFKSLYIHLSKQYKNLYRDRIGEQ